MIFVTAWIAVAGLAASVVPILIHLLMRRRRAPVPWAAMRLLREAIRAQTRRLRLEQFVVLALRCLILAAVGAAIAQPLIRGGLLARGGRVVLLVIDDGAASSARSGDGASGLARSVAAAEAIVAQLGPADQVGVISAARPARGLLLPPTGDLAGAALLLRSLAPTESPTDLPAALAALREAIDRVPPETPVAAYLLSEFRRGSAPLGEALRPLLAEIDRREVVLHASVPASEPLDNVQVVAVAPLRRLLLPGQADGSGQVSVRLARSGALEPASLRVQASIDGRAIEPRRVRFAAGQTEATADLSVDAAALPEGRRAALGLSVAIDGDRQPADDARWAVLQARPAVRVALIDRRAFGGDLGVGRLGAGQWLDRALRPSEDAPIEVAPEDPVRLQPRTLRGADAAIVARPDLLDDGGWEALRELLSRGGAVLIAPPDELRAHPWVERMSATLGLAWGVGLEATDHDEPLRLAERQPPSALLRLLESELGDLVAPVHLFRTLPVDLDQSRDRKSTSELQSR